MQGGSASVGMVGTFVNVVQRENITALWRGTSPVSHGWAVSLRDLEITWGLQARSVGCVPMPRLWYVCCFEAVERERERGPFDGLSVRVIRLQCLG